MLSLVPFLLEGNDIKTTFYEKYYDKEIYHLIYLQYAIFVSIFLLTVSNKNPILTRIHRREKDFFYHTFVSILAFILLFGKTGENLLEAGYTQFEMNTFLNLAINEYYLLFLIICLFYYKPGKLVHLLSILYVLKNLLYGGRIESLQLFIAYAVYLDINPKKLINIVYGLLLLVTFQVYGVVRSTGIGFDLFINAFSSNSSYFTLIYLKQATGTFAEVIYSSAAMYGLLEDSIITFSQRVDSTLGHLFSYILPYTLLDKDANIALTVQSKTGSGGGSLISSYFYFIGGWAVVVIGPLLYGHLYRRVVKSGSIIFQLAALIIIVTIPRWLIYNHITFVKSAFYIVIIFLIMKTLRIKKYS